MKRNSATGCMLLLMGVSIPALACQDAHEYIESSRSPVMVNASSVYAVGDKVNVTARLDDGGMIMLTVPDSSIIVGTELLLERVVLEDKLGNGDPVLKYDYRGNTVRQSSH